MKKIVFAAELLCSFLLFFMPMFVFAGSPVFTFTPLAPTTLQLIKSSSATVQYQVQNQSSKDFTMVMRSIPGITQVTTGGHCANPFKLGAKQSCLLTLQINGSQISEHVSGGPVICQQSTDGKPNPLFCYQPSLANSLNITLVPQYTIIPSASANGSISPNTPQIVKGGTTLSFTATPNTNYVTYQWSVDGVLAQTGNSIFSLSNITANHRVNVTFINPGTFYIGTQSGYIYYSSTNGAMWMATTVPANGNPINSVFALTNLLYAASADGFVYYSTDNGTTWSHQNSPDGSAINSIFATNNELYAGTANGNVSYSSDLGNTWHTVSQPDGSAIDSVFVQSNVIYAGTENGYVYYSQNNGATWTVINDQVKDKSAVKSIYITNDNTMYVGTANEHVYTTTFLTSGNGWTLNAQTAYSLFVNALTNELYAGTQSGFVVSITDGIQLGFITYSPINSVYVRNG